MATITNQIQLSPETACSCLEPKNLYCANFGTTKQMATIEEDRSQIFSLHSVVAYSIMPLLNCLRW